MVSTQFYQPIRGLCVYLRYARPLKTNSNQFVFNKAFNNPLLVRSQDVDGQICARNVWLGVNV